jgi:predicted PurR-regulated permease PerM
MKSKNSLIWLVILLCLIILGLAWLIGYNQHLQQVRSLNQEIEKLNQEVQTLKQKKQDTEVLPSPALLPSPEATFSSKPSTTSADFDFDSATSSGELD